MPDDIGFSTFLSRQRYLSLQYFNKNIYKFCIPISKILLFLELNFDNSNPHDINCSYTVLYCAYK